MPRDLIPHAAVCSVGLALVLAACSSEGTAPEPRTVRLSLSIEVYGTGIARVTAEVAAPDLPQPINAQASVADGFATLRLEILEGADRTITIRAFDAGNTESHSGTRTLDILGPPAAALTISLEPSGGGSALVATLSGWRVTVERSFVALAVGETGELTAYVIDASGDTLDVAITWESVDSDVVGVSTTDGRTAQVVAVGEGETLVTASYQGVTAGTVVTVVLVEPPPPEPLTLEPVASGFQNPVYVTHAPSDSARLFVVERGGVIRIVKGGSVLPTPFLDISSRVRAGGEQGLLSVAFHPLYAVNGEFFVYYTDGGGDSRVSRFQVSGTDPDVADPSSELLVLFAAQPYSNHNGGLLAFGADGMLYVGLGDGGSGGDPQGNGQDSTTVLGSILRLDVDGGSPYAIPADNPLVNAPAAAKEIWVYGLRNPWRYSFDRTTGDLYIGDVGQNAWEEIDVQPATSTGGENYGWNVMEGTHCYNAGTCSQQGLVLPVLEYAHSGGACSVTGGYVYRGSALADMVGRYFYGDYCAGWIRSFRFTDGSAADPQDHTADLGTVPEIVSFGEDAAGELYVVSLTGAIYRLAR